MEKLKTFIKAEAERIGFCICGFTDAGPLRDFERYTRWLEDDAYGTMGYLKREDSLAKRADPRLLLPDVRSICVLGIPMRILPAGDGPEVASYAHYLDYHDTIIPLAESLIESIREQVPEPFSCRICIDSAPVLERSLAVRAGLGWIGKSSMFISPAFGSALFLCEILLSLPIEPDQPYQKDGCGTCTRCVDACPTGCIDPRTRTIRADHCAAYLTIEHKGDFTEEQIRMVGTHLFGCDECLRACPWNSRNSGVSPLPVSLAVPGLSDESLSDEEFRDKFRGTPVLRTKAKGLRRNIGAVRKNMADGS